MSDDWGWKLRLFISVDLVGSTAFKSRKSSGDRIVDGKAVDIPIWPQIFTEFFETFPISLKSAYEHLPGSIHKPEALPQPWKFVGDEILFEVALKKYTDTLAHMCAIRDAVKRFPLEKWAAKEDNKLPLKATAWIAGFPVTNREVMLRSDGGDLRDFLGPQMDLGFRLCQCADTRRIPISVDLAMLLLAAIKDQKVATNACPIRYAGRRELKDILGGRPYPLLWVDVADQLTHEDMLLGIKNPDDDQCKCMAQFVDEFIRDTSGQRKPFIKDDAEFGEVPDELEKLRKAMQSVESTSYSAEEVPQAPGKAEQLPPPQEPPHRIKKK